MILITGTTGFIGSYLIEELKKESKDVICLVRKNSNFSKLKKLKLKILFSDILSFEDLENSLKKYHIDKIVHLAATVRSKDPKEFYRTNVIGTRNLIRVAENLGIRNFVFLSTINVLLSKKSDYSISKSIAENLVMSSKLNWTIIRPTLVYDEFGNKDLIKVVEKIKNWSIMPIIGSGANKLEPIFIKDLIKVIRKCIKQDYERKIFNVGGDKQIKFLDLVDLIAKKYNKKIRKIYVPYSIAILLSKILVKKEYYTSLIEFTQDKIARNNSTKKIFKINPLPIEDGIDLIIKNS